MFFEHKTFWLAKDVSQTEHYQDAFALDGRRGVAAIADGVSSSLFSAQWAKILCDAVVADPPDVSSGDSFFPWLARQRAAWNSAVDTENLAWHQKAKMQQGAQSTLLWVQLLPADPFDAGGRQSPRFRCFAVGDCCLLHARGSQMLRAFPIEQSQLLENNPHVLRSIESKQDQALAFQTLQDYYQPGDMLVLCTDAIAAWALKALEGGATLLWRDFWNMSQDDWAGYIGSLREQQRMRYDDATLVILRATDPSKLSARGGQFMDEAKRKFDDTIHDVGDTISDFLGGLSKRRKR